MLKYIYIFLMAISFTNTFQSKVVNFYLKYEVAIVWILIFLIDLFYKKKILKKSIDYFKMYFFPYLIILVISLIGIVIYNDLSFSNITRMVGQVSYMLIIFLSVVGAVHFFGEKTIKYSFYALILTFSANLFFTIYNHGFDAFLNYLYDLFVLDSIKRGTSSFLVSIELEIQDITMASGMYLIYFSFFNPERKIKENRKYIIFSLITFLIGFKRTGLLALIGASIVCFFLKLNEDNKKNIYKINALSLLLCIMFFVFIVFIKHDIFTIIENNFGISLTGRNLIYHNLAQYIDISPFYIGRGFSIVDKKMYEMTGFVSHTVIGKMYSEIGFIPFFIWIFYSISTISKRIFNKYSKEESKIYIVMAIYVFLTYIVENTLTLFCMQFTYMLIPLAYKVNELERKKDK